MIKSELKAVQVGHTPDADDAFMFYAMFKGKISNDPFKVIHVIQDIETLNQRAMKKELEVTAVSFHAFAHLFKDYAILPSGASVGDKYGPIVLARKPWKVSDLKGKKIAIPGLLTTAFLVMKLVEADFEPIVMPFDQILPALLEGKIEAGLIIHEGQLTFNRYPVHKVIDLGEWWHEKTGLPLVLGTNVIKKSLGKELMTRFSSLLRESIEWGLSHRKETLDYALQYGRGMDAKLGDRFIEMYVSEYTVDLGKPGRESVVRLFDQAFEKGLIPEKVVVEYVG